MTKLIYLASPYSGHPAIQELRFRAVCKVAARIMSSGQFVFSPIAHSHPIAQYGLPKDFEFWRECDTLMMTKCDELWVLMLDGWNVSKGIEAELKLADEMHKPVKFINVNSDFPLLT